MARLVRNLGVSERLIVLILRAQLDPGRKPNATALLVALRRHSLFYRSERFCWFVSKGQEHRLSISRSCFQHKVVIYFKHIAWKGRWVWTLAEQLDKFHRSWLWCRT